MTAPTDRPAGGDGDPVCRAESLFGGLLTAGYRADGLRAVKHSSAGTTYFLYDGADPVCELNASGSVTAVNTFGGAGLLSRHTAQGSTFYTFDERGNVTQRLDASGSPTSTDLYDAYGARTGTPAAQPDPFGFAGQDGGYTDAETGLVLCGHRYYDPQAGRFLNRDPAGYAGGLNLYAYCADNPVTQDDPAGFNAQNDGGDNFRNRYHLVLRTDDPDPWQIGDEWLKGTGPARSKFVGQNLFTQMLQRHEHIQDVRNQIEDDLRHGDLYPSGNDNYGLGGLKGAPLYIRDYSTLATGGRTGNLAVTYLGSYDLYYHTFKVDTVNREVEVDFHVYNASTIESATHPPVLGYTEWWHDNIGQPLDQRFSSGPMSKTTQDFYWTERLKY